MEEPTSWALLSLVFGTFLDGKGLARASCVCKSWRAVGLQEQLWEALCMQNWPSLSSPQGKALLLQQGGSFKKFYALRCTQAQLVQHTKAFLQSPHLPSLPLKDLFLLLDISHHGVLISSSIVTGDHLLPPSVGDGTLDSSFDFSVPISTSMTRTWSKEEVQEFEVSWAITAKGSQRIFQLLKASNEKDGRENKGVVVGNTCSYAQALPSPSIFCNTYIGGGSTKPCSMSQDGIMSSPLHSGPCQILVKLECSCTRSASTSPSGCVYAYADFHPLKASFAILDTLSWSCLSQAQVLVYLQLSLFHHCTFFNS